MRLPIGKYPAKKLLTYRLGIGQTILVKRYFTLTVVFFALIGFSQITFAGPERLESKEMAAAPAPPPCNWTGLYIGIHGGFGGGDFTWKDTDFGELNPEILMHQGQSGFLGGGQLGYNFQLGSFFVFGAEGEFEYSDIGGQQTKSDGDETDHYDVQNNWTGTVALRAGFTSLNNHLLTYVKGGVAFSHWEYDWKHDEGSNVDTFNTDETRTAPLLAFGWEYAFTCHWTAKLEYRHLFLETRAVSDIRIDDGNREPESYDFELHHDSVQLGVNYKF